MSRAQAQAQREAALNRRSGSQSRGGKGSGGNDRPLRMARRDGQAVLPVSIAGRAMVATPSVGGIATQLSTQPAAAAGHGVPSQSGQCVQGSEAAFCIGAALGAGADASANAGRPAARTARQLKNAAKRRRRFITPILRRIPELRQSRVGQARTHVRRGSNSPSPWNFICDAIPYPLPRAATRGSNCRPCLLESADMAPTHRSKTRSSRHAWA
jgi:hypothetical protein